MPIGGNSFGSGGALAAVSSSGGYCEQEDLEQRISKATLTQLTNDVGGSAEPDPNVVTALILQAYDTTNMTLGSSYDVPFSTTPSIIKRLNVDLACYYAIQRRFNTTDIPAGWQKTYDATIKTLERLGSGELTIPDVEPNQSFSDLESEEKLIDFEDENYYTSDF